MSKFMRYLVIAVIAFMAGIATTSGSESSPNTSVSKMTSFFNEAHAQAQAY